MDWKTFLVECLKCFTELVKALAWPVVILVLAVWFKNQLVELLRQLARLLRRARKVKYKDAEAEFAERLKEAQSDAKALPPQAAETEAPAAAEQVVQALTEQDARAAVLAAWIEVELAAREAVRRHNIELTDRQMRSPRQLLIALETAQLIDPATGRLFENLRQLRNHAAHNAVSETDSGFAFAYSDLASRIANRLRAI